MKPQIIFYQIVLICSALLFFNNSVLANSLDVLDEGQQAFNKGEYEKAFKSWWKQAIKGNSAAQVFVGLSHANGWGVAKDPDQAAVWYKMAAENKNSSGQFLYGIYLLSSNDKKNVTEGIKWLHQSAANGDNEAFQFLKKANRKNWFTVSDKLLKTINQVSFKTDLTSKTASLNPSKSSRSSVQ